MKKTLLVIFLFFGCYSSYAQSDTVLYSFFAAGHTYGNPNSTHYGLHYPFVDFIPEINSNPKMVMGFLTGDVVVKNTADYWDSAQITLDKLTMPIYIAAGNHDVGAEFHKRYGDYYYSFIYNEDLFIVLTPSLDKWNISGDQLAFLENTLDSNHAVVNNIFIFLHELIWWSPDNKYQHVEINYRPHYPGSTNYDTVVKPLLLSYSNNITVYAGDLGCTNSVSPFMYDHFDNITLIGSGMGGGVRDNIIVTNVYKDSVYYNLVAINGTDQKALGEIYDFSLNGVDDGNKPDDSINIYPNPSDLGYFTLKNDYPDSFNMNLYDSQGKLLVSKEIQKNSVNIIEAANLKAGIYLLKFNNDKKCITKKIIIR